MTRKELLARARDLWQETLGSETWGDPVGADRELSAVADELARRKKCWFGLRSVDLVAGQESISLRLVYLSGKLLNCYSITDALRYSRVYQGLTPGTPGFAVDAGKILYLAPPSSSAVAGGLGLYGFHNPGVGAACIWAGEGDENPLPDFTDECLALGLASRRASLFVGSPEMMARAAALGKRYEDEKRSVEVEAHKSYQRLERIGKR